MKCVKNFWLGANCDPAGISFLEVILFSDFGQLRPAVTRSVFFVTPTPASPWTPGIQATGHKGHRSASHSEQDILRNINAKVLQPMARSPLLLLG